LDDKKKSKLKEFCVENSGMIVAEAIGSSRQGPTGMEKNCNSFNESKICLKLIK